jgi:N-glycosylase/DNA lyase
MLSSLRTRYGTRLCHVDGTEWYAFPSVAQLARIKEDELKEMKFGYRAGFIVETAKLLAEKGGESWLTALRTEERQKVQDELVAFKGIT